MGPGEVWRTGNHSRRYSYLSDSTNDTFTSCRQYAVSYGPSSAMTISSSPNPIGKLDVLKTTDEDDGIVYSFKDYLGREILRRAIIEDDSGDDVFLDTYYCYDDMGRLSAVLPPSLSAVLDSLGYGSYYETNVSLDAIGHTSFMMSLTDWSLSRTGTTVRLVNGGLHYMTPWDVCV